MSEHCLLGRYSGAKYPIKCAGGPHPRSIGFWYNLTRPLLDNKAVEGVTKGMHNPFAAPSAKQNKTDNYEIVAIPRQPQISIIH